MKYWSASPQLPRPVAIWRFFERCQEEAMVLRRNIEQHGWDGQWYRRAYFDDGAPLGSSTNPECQIDSIAQSWVDSVRSRRSRAFTIGHGIVE